MEATGAFLLRCAAVLAPAAPQLAHWCARQSGEDAEGLCEACGALLVPGQTCRVRLKSGRGSGRDRRRLRARARAPGAARAHNELVTVCGACGHARREAGALAPGITALRRRAATRDKAEAKKERLVQRVEASLASLVPPPSSSSSSTSKASKKRRRSSLAPLPPPPPAPATPMVLKTAARASPSAAAPTPAPAPAPETPKLGFLLEAEARKKRKRKKSVGGGATPPATPPSSLQKFLQTMSP